jgi:hypothetical protein
MFNAYEPFYERTRQLWPFNRGDHMDRSDCTVYLFMMMTNEMNGLQSYDNPLV